MLAYLYDWKIVVDVKNGKTGLRLNDEMCIIVGRYDLALSLLRALLSMVISILIRLCMVNMLLRRIRQRSQTLQLDEASKSTHFEQHMLPYQLLLLPCHFYSRPPIQICYQNDNTGICWYGILYFRFRDRKYSRCKNRNIVFLLFCWCVIVLCLD